MKIEKINDNQIRCTVTMSDLHDRHLKISELITNSDKAKLFLQDMVQQASAEFGFDVEGMSLMIETTPASKDSLVFTITKMDGENAKDVFPEIVQQAKNKLFGAESLAQLLKDPAQPKEASQPKEEVKDSSCCLFSFDNLTQVGKAASVFKGLFNVQSSLYRDDVSSCYLLVIRKKEKADPDFNRACNLLSEYSVLEDSDPAILSFLKEHNRLIIAENALETLAKIINANS